MTLADGEKLIDQAAAIGAETVQFIGGEPTLGENVPKLARHALASGLKVHVYTSRAEGPRLHEFRARQRRDMGTVRDARRNGRVLVLLR